MVTNFMNGGAAINVLSRLVGSDVRVVDMGVAADLNIEGLSKAGIRVGGTGNFAKESAMSRQEAEAALLYGIGIAEEEASLGVQVLAVGEMGIGNTTASSAITAALTGLPPSALVGRGTGLDDAGLAHKISVVERALELHKPDPEDPLDVLSKVGGLEIAGLCGFILGAAANRRPVVLDGFISTAAALLAVKLSPSAYYYLIPSHLSREPGHEPLLEYMNLKPLLHLNMRLGEGTGAALCLNLLEGAVRLLSEMATFAEAGVSEKKGG
jgi:nicotinate-nucleotide--dimethylbenzimidazole phosphoribosyltransferase